MTKTVLIQADYKEHQTDTFSGYVVIAENQRELGRFRDYAEASIFAQAHGDQVFTMSSVDNYHADLRTALASMVRLS